MYGGTELAALSAAEQRLNANTSPEAPSPFLAYPEPGITPAYSAVAPPAYTANSPDSDFISRVVCWNCRDNLINPNEFWYSLATVI